MRLTFCPDAFAARLIQRRKELGWSMQKLAQRAGIDPCSVADYERRRRRPRTDMLALVVQALDVSADWLLFGEERKT